MQQFLKRCSLPSRLGYLLVVACVQAAGANSPYDAVAEGGYLFSKTFVPGRTEAGNGDGLGPLYNHVSCVGCHRQGAVGGGGGIEFNVVLITAQPPDEHRTDDKRVARSLQSLHHGFITGGRSIASTILLHRFGPDEQYFARKMSLGGLHVPLDLSDVERRALQTRLTREPLHVIEKMNRIKLIRSQRNTTALFGVGLIDKVTDEALHQVAKHQAAEGLVSGRVPPVGHDKVGRFGWRGQKEHLHDFVLAACANELGLAVPGNPQPRNPVKPRFSSGLDLTHGQCQALTAFVAALPRPKEAARHDGDRQADRRRGNELFDSVGCSACHLKRLDSIEGIYSDLLLHDMGSQLSDPSPAEPTLTFVRDIGQKEPVHRPESHQPLPNSPSYFGGSSPQLVSLNHFPSDTIEIREPKSGARKLFRIARSNVSSEWRTPPLWGVADSAPYLHDGRAENVVDAILWHGGEAEFAVKRFRELELVDRMRLIAFLRTLHAP